MRKWDLAKEPQIIIFLEYVHEAALPVPTLEECLQEELFGQEEGLENIALLHDICFPYYRALMSGAEKANTVRLRVARLSIIINILESHQHILGESWALVSARLAQHACPHTFFILLIHSFRSCGTPRALIACNHFGHVNPGLPALDVSPQHVQISKP